MLTRINVDKARPQERYEVREERRSPEGPPARRGTTRTASEPRGPPSRQMSRDMGRRQPPPRRRPSDEEEEGDDYPGELYDMYSSPRGSKTNRRPQPKYIEEEEEDPSDYDDGSFDENDFEMVSNRPPNGPRSRVQSQAVSGRGQSRRPDIRKIRIKVHADTDDRYVMVGSAVEFRDLVDKIREKFELRKRFKLKIRDDDSPGDMITMGDQDDLEMALMIVKSNARKERLEMGKMEVSSCMSFTSNEC